MNAPVSFDDLPDEKCAWCGKEYMPRTYNHKYCCEACRYASASAFDKQWRADERAKLKCRQCGGPITGKSKRSALYCGTTCQSAARADRKFGRVADLRCVDCGGPIPDAGKRDTKLCMSCARDRHRKSNRERARERRAMLRLCRVE